MRNLLLIMLVCLLTPLHLAGQDKKNKKYVVVIGVDGLGSWGVRNSHTPVLDSLMRNGSYSLEARAVNPTLSAPNWASMIMGVTPKKHGIKGNKWDWEDRKGKDYPTMFKVLKQQRPELSLVVFHQWDKLIDLVEQDFLTLHRHTKGENNTMRLALDHLLSQQPDLTFIHLDHVDSAGHHFGHKSREYEKAVLKTDSLVGAFISEVNGSELKDRVIFIVTSDHGFSGIHHGHASRKTRTIPWIAAGPGIRKGFEISSKVNTTDTAATIMALFGCGGGPSCQGRVIPDILE